MPKFIVALDTKSRHARSALGKFGFMAAHQRLVWRKEETEDIVRLAELVNEATPFLRQYGSLPHGLIVLQVDKPVEQPPVESTAPEPEDVEPPTEEDLAAALGQETPVFEPELTEEEVADLENSGDQQAPIEAPDSQEPAGGVTTVSPVVADFVPEPETPVEDTVTERSGDAEKPAAAESQSSEPEKPKRKLRKKKTDESGTN